MSSASRASFVTTEEYLALERAATEKSEYVNGQIHALSGASREHNLIATNLIREIATQLRGRPCEAYGSDMRVKVPATGMYSYPDLVVACGEPRFEDEHVDTLLDPTLLVEILSPSTEAYDRGDKFAHYRRIESLREHVLVAQHRMLVERFTRQDDVWVLAAATDPDAVVELSSIGCTLRMREVYERVEFARARG
ncbi:MAG TPA: Uma2 family endonuclease [Gemmatimonadales bacterium]